MAAHPHGPAETASGVEGEEVGGVRRLVGLPAVVLILTLLAILGTRAFAQAPLTGSGSDRRWESVSGGFALAYDADQWGDILWIGHGAGLLQTEFVTHERFRTGRERTVSEVQIQLDGESLTASSQLAWGRLSNRVLTYPGKPGVVRVITQISTRRPLQLSGAYVRFAFSGIADGERPSIVPYVVQKGPISGLAYLYEARSDTALLFLENFTSMNEHYSLVQGSVSGLVTIDADGVTYRLPDGRIPAGTDLVVADTLLRLWPGKPEDDLAAAHSFLEGVADLYDLLEKPQTSYTDWPGEVVPQELRDILDPSNWYRDGRGSYLKAYVGDRRAGAELNTQLDVLMPLLAFRNRFADSVVDEETDRSADALVQRLVEALGAFLRPPHFVSNNFPPPADEWDAWYFIYPNIKVAELALRGNEAAKEVMPATGRGLIELGRSYGYEFPQRMRIDGTSRGKGGRYEYDCTGAFAYLMLQLHELTGEVVYLEEAKRAAAHLRGKGFEYAYELHMTAVGVAAMAWLYQLTGDATYLALLEIPLANLLQNTWLWENEYGYAKFYQTFLATAPTPGNALIAQFEQHNVWQYLRETLDRAGEHLPRSLQKLLPELIKYQLSFSRFTLPPYLPKVMVSATPDLGENRVGAFIPLEDLSHGWQKAGVIGQELYGAGGPIRYAAEAYRNAGGRAGVTIYAEYPIRDMEWDPATERVRFRLWGDPAYQARVLMWKGFPRSFSDVGPLELQASGGTWYQLEPSTSVQEPSNKRPSFDFAVVGVASRGQAAAQHGRPWVIPTYLKNNHNDSLTLKVVGPLPHGWDVEPTGVELDPGEGRSVNFTVHIPPSENRKSVPFELILAAISVENAPVRLLSVLVQIMEANAALNKSSPLPQSLLEIQESNPGGSWGFVRSPEMWVDLDQTPILHVDARAATGAWALKVVESGGDPDGIYLQGDTQAVGTFSYDLREKTGWSGLRRVSLLLFAVGEAARVQFGSIQFREDS